MNVLSIEMYVYQLHACIADVSSFITALKMGFFVMLFKYRDDDDSCLYHFLVKTLLFSRNTSRANIK